jgi:hypothetical protein
VGEFLRIFGVMALFAAGGRALMGMLPWELAAVAALVILGVAIHHHRNRSPV